MENASSAGRTAAAPLTRRDDVVVVVPTYEEAENLPQIVAAVRRLGFRLLIVDDASPDGTGELADSLAAGFPGMLVLHRSGKGGLGPAYAAGFDRAFADGAAIVCEMDADLSHDPADLPRLVAAVDAGADLAIGSRYVPGGGTRGWSRFRRLLSRGGNLYARAMLGLDVADATAGFRAYRADALRRLDPGSCQASGYGFQIEMTWRARQAGMDIREVPIVFSERIAGASKMSAGIAIEAITLVTRWGMDRLAGDRAVPLRAEGTAAS